MTDDLATSVIFNRLQNFIRLDLGILLQMYLIYNIPKI